MKIYLIKFLLKNNRINKLYKKYINFILYSLIGVSGVSLDFILFYIFTAWFGLYYIYANVISISIGIINNFILNAFINFKKKDDLLKRFIKFYAVGLLGMGISSLLLFVFKQYIGLPITFSKVLTIGIATVVQFTLNSKFTFQKHIHI